MRFIFFFVFTLMGLKSAQACNLEITTETLLGLSAGTICASATNVRTDQRGPYRMLQYNVIDFTLGLQEFPDILIRPSMTKPLRTADVPGLGVVSLMILKVKSLNSATLSFLNGNSLSIQIDDYGRFVPDQICVQQVGVNQLRGSVGRCP